MWASLNNWRDGALLFLRLAFGCFYISIHGWSRLAGGMSTWKKLGLPMKHLGITFLPELWGFMAAFASTVGVLFLILGLLFRPFCLLIAVCLAVVILSAGGTFANSYHSVELFILIVSLLFLGPGRYSFDKA